MVRTPLQDEIWLVALDPVVGSEMEKTRPALVISPDQMNQALDTVTIAPMTTTQRSYPTRVGLRFQGKNGQVALDQLRAVDRSRLTRRLGVAPAKTSDAVSSVLIEMFTRTNAANT